MFTSPLLSRLAALLLLAAVLAAAYLWILEPLRASYHHTNTAIAEARALLVHLDRLAADHARLAEEARTLEKQPVPTAYYLSGETDALAAATLQGRVQTLIGANAGMLNSTQPLGGQQQDGTRRVAIRVQMTATLSSLLGMLHSLETGHPLLFIDNLDVQTPFAHLDPDRPLEQELTLAVGFDLYGYLPPPRLAAARSLP